MSKAIRRVPVFGWIGAVLLAFSLGIAVWVSVRGVRAEDGGAPPAKPGTTKVAGSYAYVDVEGGVAKLYTLQPGRVVKVLVHDNDVTDKDAPLVQLDDTVAKADLVRARAALKVAENDRDKAKFLTLQRTAQLAGQTAALAAKRYELEAAQAKRDEAKRLQNLGVSKETLAAAEATVQAYEEGIKIQEQTLLALQGADTPPLDQSSAEEQVKEKQALVTKAEWAVRECTIKAPAKGTVLRVMVAEGDVLGTNPREPAVMFCPNELRILRAEVEQEFASRLSLNQTAVVRDDSTNSPLFTGKVTRLSDWYSHRRSMVQEPLQFNDVRTLECIITLDPSEKASLRIGQRVRVTFESGN